MGIGENVANLHEGFQIEIPSTFVPWIIKESVMFDLFNKKISKVTSGYYVLKNTVSLGGLKCNIGFHFNKTTETLRKIEFFREIKLPHAKSFEEFQTYFEKSYGKPSESNKGTEGFNDYIWDIGADVKIFHNIFDRFGLEEHMYIEKT